MRTPPRKFKESDRYRVVAFIEERHGVRLRRRGSARKILEDDAGRRYFVFGACGHWHGVKTGDLDATAGTDATLVVAVHRGPAIDVYEGPLRPLADRRHALSTTRDGCYQFHTERGAGHLRVKEVPGLSLPLIGCLDTDDYARADRPAKRPPTPEERILEGFEHLALQDQMDLIDRLKRRLAS